MAPGEFVIYLADPLDIGKMVILSVEDDGLLMCESVASDSHGRFYRDKFHAQELELYSTWARVAA